MASLKGSESLNNSLTKIPEFAHLLYERDDVTEIAVNRPGEVWYEAKSAWEKIEVPAADFKWLKDMGVQTAQWSDNDFNTDKAPILSAVMPDRERAQFVMPSACEEGTISLTIRKPSKTVFSMDQYTESGFFENVLPVSGEVPESDKELLELLEKREYRKFLQESVIRQKNIVVAGATGSGKTTFMKTLNEEIPATDRIITIEDVPELFLPNHPNHVHLFYTSAQREQTVVTPAALLKSCLRMKPDRILLAELRGAEAWDFIQICASGHGGSITSLHAGSVAEAFERLLGMYLSNPQGRGMAADVIMKTLYMTIDVVVHMDNHHGKRGITQIYFDPKRKLSGGVG